MLLSDLVSLLLLLLLLSELSLLLHELDGLLVHSELLGLLLIHGMPLCPMLYKLLIHLLLCKLLLMLLKYVLGWYQKWWLIL